MIKKNSKKILYKKQTHTTDVRLVWATFSFGFNPLPYPAPTLFALADSAGAHATGWLLQLLPAGMVTKQKKAKSNLVFENPNQTRAKKLSKIFQNAPRRAAISFQISKCKKKNTFKYRCAISLLRAHTPESVPFRRNRPNLPPRGGGLLSTMHVRRLLDGSERILLDGVFSDSKQDIVI